MKLTYYQDQYCYYFWKPAGIPSSFGKGRSFLDLLLEEKAAPVQSLFAFFGKEKEFGLLNRLDNETTGLLYFAKNPRVYHEFKAMQSAFLLRKYYLAEVYGDITKWLNNPSSAASLQLPIAHHRYNPDRMVVVKQPSDRDKTKGALHYLTTEIIEFQFLPASNTSTLLIGIQKGIRHQIRAHLASVGYPICGDTIYSKSDHKHCDTLQLFSVGVETE